MIHLVYFIVSCLVLANAITLDEFGAIENVDNWKTAVHNADAMHQALVAANSSASDRTVVIPSGKVYFLANSTFTSFFNVNIEIEGKIVFSNHINDYFDAYGEGNFALWKFYGSEGIHVGGSGVIDGQGMNWWRLCYLGTDNRPNMFDFESTRDITFSNIYLTNSPRFSINFKDCRDIVIHDMTIFIDSHLTRLFNRSSVMYPLNTDGIDIAAENVTIFNTNITNYDDAIVAKPCRSNWKYCTCSGSIYAYNNNITYSTGLTIGSVPPNADVNCVRNVTFKDTTMFRPLKALYIKTNPGTSGIGIVEDITYENIYIHTALWWTVFIGPQQQNQPGNDSASTGCNFLFPFVPVCPTQPLVSIKRVTLKNVVAVDTVPLFESPGVVLCDPTNPCTDFVFDNVVNKMYTGNITDILEKFPIPAPGIIFPTPYRPQNWTWDYVMSNVYGASSGKVNPKVCLDDPTCWWTDPSAKVLKV